MIAGIRVEHSSGGLRALAVEEPRGRVGEVVDARLERLERVSIRAARPRT